MRIGELLLHHDVITQEQLDAALRDQRRAGGLLGEHLLRHQAVTEPVLHYHLGLQRSLRQEEQRRFSRLRPLGELFARFYSLSPRGTLASIALIFLSVALRLTFPYYVKLVFDFPSDHFTAILALSAAMVVLQVLGQVASYQGQQLFNTANARFSTRVREQLYAVLQHLHATAVARRSSGEWLTRLSTDVDNLVDRWAHLFTTFFKNLSAILLSCLILSLLDPLLTGVVLGLSLLMVVVPGRISNGANAYLMRRPVLIGDMVGLLRERVAGVKALKTYNGQPAAEAELGRRFDTYYRNDFRMVRMWNVAFNLRVVMGALMSGLILFVGGHRVIDGQYSSGDLMLIIIIVGMLAPYIDDLMQAIIKANDVKRYWLRCAELLHTNVDLERFASPAGEPARQPGEVRCEGLSFAYSGRKVLDRVTLHLAPRRSYALVGRSGSGKSTLLKLLLKELEPSEGRILLDGQPLSELSEAAVCHQVSYVSQRPIIFPDTVANNLRLGGQMFAGEVTPERLEEAARRAGIHERILALPQGYETRIGEGGHMLSGGERQRIAIARALLKSPSLCLFDEPTSALDPENAALVMETVLSLRGQCTVLISTHDLALIAKTDEVLLLDEGALRVTRPDALDREGLLAVLEGRGRAA
jgi:ATP-binding cassette subfamily B protein